MHKAITIIQLKLEAAIIDRRPELGMGNRKLLHLIDFERGVFMYDGKEYALRDTNFPTIDPADPYRLTEEEHDLMEKIHASFMNSEKLKNTCAVCLPTVACIWYATVTYFIMRRFL